MGIHIRLSLTLTSLLSGKRQFTADFAQKIEDLRNKAAEELRVAFDVSPERGRSFVDFFSDHALLKRIENPLKIGVQSVEDKGVGAHPFSGKKFYVIGQLDMPPKRVADLVKKRGGEMAKMKADADFILLGGKRSKDLKELLLIDTPLSGFKYSLIDETGLTSELIDEKRFISLANFFLEPKNREQIEYLISVLI